MSDRPPERWCLILDVPDGTPAAAVTVRRLLKTLWRRWGIRCKGFSVDRRMYEMEREIERLRAAQEGTSR